MAFVIAEPCIGNKDASCVDECPVDCIHEGEDQYYIDPDECINCGICATVCPFDAIFDEAELPDEWAEYTEKNRAFFQ